MTDDSQEVCSTITRRSALGAIAVATMGSVVMATEAQQHSRLGLVAFNCAIRRKWLQQRDPKFDLFEPLNFLKHCHSVGAGGMQTSLGVLDVARVKSLKEFAAEHSLCIDGIVNSPSVATTPGRLKCVQSSRTPSLIYGRTGSRRHRLPWAIPQPQLPIVASGR
jgi:hypothetical protein